MKYVYIDHGATTPMDPQVAEAMQPYYSHTFGNPSSLHRFGDAANDALSHARQTIGQALGITKGEITFTGGGSEANNLALIGAAKRYQKQGNHIIVSAIEHDSIMAVCKYLEKEGFEITYLPVDEHGVVKLEELERALSEQTILVSIMHANNEVGTIQPIEEISQMITSHRKTGKRLPLFHCDATQTVGKIPVHVDQMGVDLLTLSAHKVYGPKGVGALFVRRGVRLQPLIHGGGQENGLRSGTQNVAGIVGMAKAVQLLTQNLDEIHQKYQDLNRQLRSALNKIDGVIATIPSDKCLPSHFHFRVDRVEGQAIMLELTRQGIAVSTGSACHASHWEPSHVMLAMGYTPEKAHQGVRMTLGKDVSSEDINYISEQLESIVKSFQAKMS